MVAASTGCDNLYYPIKPGETWVYRYTSGALELTETVSDITANSFILHYAMGASTLPGAIRWTCGSGGLTSGDFNPGGAPSGPTQLAFQIVRVTGISIPAPDKWLAGAAWRTTYDVKVQMSTPGGKMSGTGKITVSYKIVAKDNVTVPAGTFAAWKVADIIAENLTMKANGRTMPFVINAPGTVWYVAHVGMVKNEAKTPAGVTTVELVSYKG
ncbi:MAG: hypothetical protein M1118_01850 [Chloroflexi bacterium]|nr:hypothetical protein [Chloroflexota bacterium]